MRFMRNFFSLFPLPHPFIPPTEPSSWLIVEERLTHALSSEMKFKGFIGPVVSIPSASTRMSHFSWPLPCPSQEDLLQWWRAALHEEEKWGRGQVAGKHDSNGGGPQAVLGLKAGHLQTKRKLYFFWVIKVEITDKEPQRVIKSRDIT